jgi:hypothetical protein
MGDFVSFDKLEHSQEIAIGGRRYRLWNECVLVEHTPVQ